MTTVMFDWYSTDYYRDFEYILDIDSGGDAIYDLWMKAYDTEPQENDADCELYADGFMFHCLIRLRDCISGNEIPLADFAAKSEEEAQLKMETAAKQLLDHNGSETLEKAIFKLNICR